MRTTENVIGSTACATISIFQAGFVTPVLQACLICVVGRVEYAPGLTLDGGREKEGEGWRSAQNDTVFVESAPELCISAMCGTSIVRGGFSEQALARI